MELKLKSIRISNFKSFRGDHQISGFDDHFTAIVGPNGSGKSNVLDSILFVLGFRAKKMRQSSLKSLVTTGCEECYVELGFGGFTAGRRVIVGDAKAISKYYLDGREVSNVEMKEHFGKYGLDLDTNRFLILQGEIESIAMMGSKELLEYIEECIGTAKFRPKIASLNEEVKRIEEKAAVAEHTFKFIESDYKFKKGQFEERVANLSVEENILRKKKRVIEMKHEICMRKAQESSERKKVLLEELEEIRRKVSEIKDVLKGLGSESGSLRVYEKEKSLNYLKEECQRYEREKRRIIAAINKADEDIEQEMKKNKEIRGKIEAWEEKAKDWERQLARCRGEMESIEERIMENKAKLGAFRSHEDLSHKKSEYEKELVCLLQKRDKYLREQERVVLLREELCSLKKVLQAPIPEIPDNFPDIITLKKDLDVTRAELMRRKTSADEHKNAEIEYKKEEEVMNATRYIKGVYGPLRSLGTVSAKYEAAMDAATKAFSSILVDTTETARECIRIISSKKIGRTTFVVLDKLNKNIPVFTDDMLCKYVNCDPLYLPAFYYALGDTLIASTLEEARKVAFGHEKRRRVVTLEGHLVEKSGVMSGGKIQGRLRSVSELERVYEKMKGMYDDLKARLSQRDIITNNINTAKKRLCEIEEELRNSEINEKIIGKFERELEETKAKIAECERVLPEELKMLSHETKSLCHRMGELDSEIRILTSHLSSCPAPFISSNIEALQKYKSSLRVPCEPQWTPLLIKAYQTVVSGEPESQFITIMDISKAEEAYLLVAREYKRIQEKIKSIREEADNWHEREAEARAKIDDIEESEKECAVIKKNCGEKLMTVINDLQRTRELLHCLGERTKEAEEEPLDTIETEELRRKSKELIVEIEKCEVNYSSSGSTTEEYKILLAAFKESQLGYRKAQEEQTGLEQKKRELMAEHDAAVSERLRLFMSGLADINKSLKEIFSSITSGGNAELELLNFLDPFGEGIQLSIMPPKKSWKGIASLSGGEKTLSSISLIFALHRFTPSPIYVMDEIDAALDHHNVDVIAKHMKNISAQFIVVSLRSNMFEAAPRLLGVYKSQNISKTVLVDTIRMKASLSKSQ